MQTATQIADFFITIPEGTASAQYLPRCAHAVLECIAQKLADENRLTNAALNQVVFDQTHADLSVWLKGTAVDVLVCENNDWSYGIMRTLTAAVNANRNQCYGCRKNPAA